MAADKENLTSSAAKTQQGESSTGQGKSGQQNLTTRSQTQGGGVARTGYDASYIPSPAQFFTNPFAVMRRMQDDMDRMFAQALGGGLMSAGQGSGSGGGMGTWAPAIEVKQRGNDLVVSAELPGIQPDEVHVEVNQDALVIQGERRQEQSSDEGGVHRTERHYGQFYRAIPLPEGANADQAKANFQHGVLEVTVPMPNAHSRSRQIPITSGSGTGSQSSGSTQGSSSKGSSTGSSTGGSGGRT